VIGRQEWGKQNSPPPVSPVLVDFLSHVHASSGLICSGDSGTVVQWSHWFENILATYCTHFISPVFVTIFADMPRSLNHFVCCH